MNFPRLLCPCWSHKPVTTALGHFVSDLPIILKNAFPPFYIDRGKMLGRRFPSMYTFSRFLPPRLTPWGLPLNQLSHNHSRFTYERRDIIDRFFIVEVSSTRVTNKGSFTCAACFERTETCDAPVPDQFLAFVDTRTQLEVVRSSWYKWRLAWGCRL